MCVAATGTNVFCLESGSGDVPWISLVYGANFRLGHAREVGVGGGGGDFHRSVS